MLSWQTKALIKDQGWQVRPQKYPLMPRGTCQRSFRGSSGFYLHCRWVGNRCPGCLNSSFPAGEITSAGGHSLGTVITTWPYSTKGSFGTQGHKGSYGFWVEPGGQMIYFFFLLFLLTKQETLLERCTQAESSRVREPRRTALPRDLKSQVLW